MTVVFKIKYRAGAGETLCLVASGVTYAMDSIDNVLWQVKIHVAGPMSYHYELRKDSEVLRTECIGAERFIRIEEGVKLCRRSDVWLDYAEQLPFSSSFFSKSINRRVTDKRYALKPSSVILECKMGAVNTQHSLAVVGAATALGAWSLRPEMVMDDSDFPFWRVAVPLSALGSEYKFVLVNRSTMDIVAWEDGNNRRLLQEFATENTKLIYSVRSPRITQPEWRGIGVSIPVFSLRSERSMGVGDFEDLKKMVDWAVEREMSVIQILPINDTMMYGTWQDSYPYNANSNIALHPIYLALRSVAELKNDTLNTEFEARAAELNALEQMDYEAVMRLKIDYLREAYAQEGRNVKRRKTYKEFRAKNDWWLTPHALFSYLRDKYQTPHFEEWGDQATFSKGLLDSYLKGEKGEASLREMEFYIFLQYHLHEQLSATTEYARSCGVALKGDIPIGISRTSVDAWQSPELFNLDKQTGAPPDAFSALGQNWGFPTYNWERMAEDGYSWWRGRMQKMAEYFDAYRIDHILGFFRIWEIPHGTVHGLTGYFKPAMPLSFVEIASYGFDFYSAYTEPMISDNLLAQYSLSIDDLGEYLEETKAGRYRFKNKYSTQLGILQNVEDEQLRLSLMSLHDERLFVCDMEQGGFHPRIMGAQSHAFEQLSEEQKRAFVALHDDFYYRRHNDYWRDSALQKLPTLIRSTQMLVCAEDLGMIPACVPSVMQELQLLTLEIERMPKDYGVCYGEPYRYPYLSVCTTSTHDMSPLRAWWREDREQVQQYYNNALRQKGEAPEDCSAKLVQKIIDRNVSSQSMLTILPWQDWIGVDAKNRNEDPMRERINIPANPRHYWRWRMHICLP